MVAVQHEKRKRPSQVPMPQVLIPVETMKITQPSVVLVAAVAVIAGLAVSARAGSKYGVGANTNCRVRIQNDTVPAPAFPHQYWYGQGCFGDTRNSSSTIEWIQCYV